MRRRHWMGALGMVLVSAGLASAQKPSLLDHLRDRPDKIVSIREMDGPEQKARLVQSWALPGGRKACQVQVLETGEMLTIVETPAAATKGGAVGAKTVGVQIYHWGNETSPPEGTPVPPGYVPKSKAVATSTSTLKTPTAAEVPVPDLLQGMEAAAAAAKPSGVRTSAVKTVAATTPVVKPTAASAPVTVSAPVASYGKEDCVTCTPTTAAAPGKGDGCGAYVYRYERVPRILFKPGTCVPICPPYQAPDYGYHQTQWRSWPTSGPAPLGELPPAEPLPTPATSAAKGR